MSKDPHKHSQYTLRIPDIAMDKIKYIAARNCRSANKEIERLIFWYIENYEKKHGVITFEEFKPNIRRQDK